jgi:hypothetical protein
VGLSCLAARAIAVAASKSTTHNDTAECQQVRACSILPDNIPSTAFAQQW